MDGDRLRWDQRYQRAIDDDPSVGAVVQPAPPEVLTHVPSLADHLATSGRAVDIACGPGPVTLWLAERGLDVVALDVSPVAIGMLGVAARDRNLGDRISGRVIDLDLGLPDDVVDVDLISCQRFRDPALYPVILQRLRSGGIALVTVLSAVGTDDPGQFHAPAGELLDSFPSSACDLLHHCERDGLASIVVRRR